MIGTLDIELSAHDPQRPIRAISAHIGSPTSVRIRNVPRRVGEWRITSVRVSATYPDGTTVEADAVPTGGVYVATIEGCETAGTSRNGFAVKADGIDENGATVHDYTLGRGDVFILSDDGRQLPQTPLTAVNILPSRPTVPHVGDAVWADGGALEIWDGHAWRSPAPGGGSVDSVNGQTGTVVLTGEDIQTSGDDEETLSDKVVTLGTELGSHTADVDNPHSVSARQVGAYTSEEVDDRLELKQDALTDAQIAVLDSGPYIPATPSEQVEGSFDIPAGTLQYISASSGDFGDSLSKSGKEVATEEQVESAKTELNSRIDLIEATSRPNMNIVGSPTFREGNVSGFSANDYLVFPTAVSVGQNTVEFHMAFHTGSDVNTQQNIMDSWCGLAFAIRNGTTVTAISTNGTSFLAESTGGTIRANNSYRMKMLFSYEDGQYRTRIYLADGAGEFVEVGTGFTADAPVYATATYWGGANPGHATHAFGGIINLNECRMLVNGVEVWRGYDELPTVKFDPTATPRLDTAAKIVGVIEDAVSLNNRFLTNDTTAAIQTRTDYTAEWANEIRFDKGYEPLSGSEMAKLDKSVQTITLGVGESSLDIVLPDAVDGTVRELVVYVKAADSDCALNFPAGTYYGDDPNGAKAVAGGVTAVYLTEMGEGGWMLRIMELEQHTVGDAA